MVSPQPEDLVEDPGVEDGLHQVVRHHHPAETERFPVAETVESPDYIDVLTTRVS